MASNPSFREFTRVYAVICRLSAVLPFEGRDFKFIGSRLIAYFNVLSGFVFWSTSAAYIVSMLSAGKSLKADAIYVTLLLTGALWRYYVMLSDRQDFGDLFARCRELWEFCDESGRRTVRSDDRKVRLIYLFYNSCSCVSVSSLAFASYNARLPPLEPNGTERRLLTYNCMEEDEPYKYLGYQATFFIQLTAVMTVIVFGICCDASASICLMMAAGFFRQLGDRLRSDSTQDDRAEIMRCVKYHQSLLDYCFKLKSFFRSILLAQIVTSWLCISLVLVKLVSNDLDRWNNLPIMIVCMCQLFVIQWTADKLSDQSEDLAFEVYSVLTRRLNDESLRHNLQIMLARAQTPVSVMAGGFIELSLENYAAMMKGAYSFFTVLGDLGM